MLWDLKSVGYVALQEKAFPLLGSTGELRRMGNKRYRAAAAVYTDSPHCESFHRVFRLSHIE
jgi:hypothetical protein